MRLSRIVLFVLATFAVATVSSAEVQITGRVFTPKVPGSDQMYPFTAIYTFAGVDGPMNEPVFSRTWELAPESWYFMSAGPGKYTTVYSNPAKFMRPIVRTNLYLDDGEVNDTIQYPHFDYACFDESGWDEDAARCYYQTFVAKGTSVTSVGIKAVHDGVDAGGPGGQPILISVHKDEGGTPDTWPQVGPTTQILNLDCGGQKNYTYSAGWNSGEVPLVAGERYAVKLIPKEADGKFQMWIRKNDPDLDLDCYRVGVDGKGDWMGTNLWMAVASDGDGLLIPYNKRVHDEFPTTLNAETGKEELKFAGTAHKVCQTYVAQGKSLASALLYAAVSGAQPPITRQRALVRVREGGPSGPIVGVEKIAAGNGSYTGDASWGVFTAAYSPGEVPLKPGETYAVEFESIENYETLHGYINKKGVESQVKPGFNAYQKADFDEYDQGAGYLEGRRMPFDLDMQIIEYANGAEDWEDACDSENLVANGDFEKGDLGSDDNSAGNLEVWKSFSIDPQTAFSYMTDPPDNTNRMVRVVGGGYTDFRLRHDSSDWTTVDGGYVQGVSGLDSAADYVLGCDLRSSWRTDEKHAVLIGYDLTGQTDNPEAETIVWSDPLPSLQGIWRHFQSKPITPDGEIVSIWLRGWTTERSGYPFKVDFDNVTLRKVKSGVPQAD